MIFQVAGARAVRGFRHPVRTDAFFPEALICELIIAREIQIMLDQRRARVRVVADAIASYPGIHQREAQQKNYQQGSFEKSLPRLRIAAQDERALPSGRK